MIKIAIIACWFGPTYPNYFGLWLKSIAANSDINFFIFGDNKPLLPTPDNFHFSYITLQEFEKLTREKLREPSVNIPFAYKVCDFKPMYGEIFADYLGKYDFWAHCDLDMIFGNIREFISDDVLNLYDKIYPNGHLSVYRNTQEVNQRWRIPDAKFNISLVLSRPINFAFDEWDGIYNIYMINNFPFYRNVDFLDPVPGTKRLRFIQRSNPKYERRQQDYTHQVFYWENGHFYRAYLNEQKQIITNSYVYMHFQKRRFPTPNDTLLTAPAFYCTPSGFVQKSSFGIPSYDDLLTFNPYPGKIYETWEAWWSRKKSKISRLMGKSVFAPKSLKLEGKSWQGNPNTAQKE